MINPELIRESDIFSSSEICDIGGAVYYTKTYNFHIDPHRYSNHSIMYMPPTITTNSQVSRDEFMSLLTSQSCILEDIELFIHSGDYLFQVFRGYDELNYRYYFTLEEYRVNKKSENMPNLQDNAKGVFFLALEEAQEYYKKGGVHREIALKTGYTVEELTIPEDEWKDKFVGNEIKGYYMTSMSEVFGQRIKCSEADRSTFKTEQQAKEALAYAQLTQLMALPEYNGTWEPDWSNPNQFKCSILRLENVAVIVKLPKYYNELTFSSEIRCSNFLRKNKRLVNEFLQITNK